MTDDIRGIIEGVDRDESQYVSVDRQRIAYDYIQDCINEGVDPTTGLGAFMEAIEP